ncbi:MAG: hypothetical protein AAFV29_19860, partial [Myxococcota bacterium]
YSVIPPQQAEQVMRNIGRQYTRLVDEKKILHGDLNSANIYLVTPDASLGRNAPQQVRFLDPDQITPIEFTEEGLVEFERELVQLFNTTSALRPFSVSRREWNQIFESALDGISDPQLQEAKERVLRRIRLGAL